MTEQNQLKKQKVLDQPPRPQNIGIKGIEIYIPSQVCASKPFTAYAKCSDYETWDRINLMVVSLYTQVMRFGGYVATSFPLTNM